jgi:transmembrane sensor
VGSPYFPVCIGYRRTLFTIINMDQDRFLQLLSRKMAGEATIQELDELDKLLQRYEEWRRLAGELTTDDFSVTEQDVAEAAAAFGVHMEKMGRQEDQGGPSERRGTPVLSEQEPASRFRWLKAVTLVAASFLLVVAGIYTYTFLNRQNRTSDTNEITTKRGSMSQIKLPDGTRVWLNSDSKLVYSKDFGTTNREVRLTGEAFFDVVHDNQRPFIIHTDRINITDIGTAFNVKDYAKDATVETALFRGSIAVTFNDRPTEKIILKPSEKLIVKKDIPGIVTGSKDNGSPKIELSNINVLEDSTVVETAWMNNNLVFSNERLADIADMLERRFDVEVVITDSTLADAPYTGNYGKESLAQILEYMSLSKHFNYSVQAQKVTIGK